MNPNISGMLQQGAVGQGHLHALQQQRLFQAQQQQMAAATHLANNAAAANLHSDPSGMNPLDNFGNTGGMSYSLDAANAAKQMAALQAAGRSRAQSHSGPGNQGGFSNQGNPANGMAGLAGPQNTGPAESQAQAMQRSQLQNAQNMILKAMLTNRPPNFLPQLAEAMTMRGSALPPAMTGVPSPNYDPNNTRARGIVPGSSIGTFNFFGKDVDLHMLMIWIIQRGGSQKAQFDDNAWESFLSQIGLPRHQPPLNPGQPPMDLVQLLKHHYAILLQPFEGQWMKVVQQKVMMTIRHQQQMSAIAAGNATVLNGQQGGGMPNLSNVHQFGGMANASVPQQQAQPHFSGLQAVNLSQQNKMLPHQDHTQQSLSGLPQLPQTPNALVMPQQTPASTLPSMPGLQGVPFPSQEQPHHQNSLDSMPPLSASSDLANNILANRSTPELSLLSGDAQLDGLTDGDLDARKRKRTDTTETDGKRPKLEDTPMADALPVQGSSTSLSETLNHHQSPTRPTTINGAPGAGSPKTQQRLKVTYRPLFRQLNTSGGRNIPVFEHERARVASRRSVRATEEWGEIDIEGIVMSLRSRLAVEITYALSALLALSVAGRTEQQAFPLQPCEDLLPVLLELLKDQAFDNLEDEASKQPSRPDPSSRALPKIWTHQELVKAALEEGSETFGPGFGVNGNVNSRRRNGTRMADPSKGPTERPAEIVMLILQFFRNLTFFPVNAEFLANDPTITDLLLRLCCLEDEAPMAASHPPQPLSPAFTLTDLVKVQDHVMQYLASTAQFTKLDNLLPQTPQRMFRLAASYIVSPFVSVPPSQAASQPHERGQPPVPPSTPDLAVDFFSRISQRDNHRRIFSNAVYPEEVFVFFTALTRMLPISKDDYTVMTLSSQSLEPWVGYAERIVLSIYSLVFLAPPVLKRRMKRPGITSILRRLSQFYMKCVTPDGKQFAPTGPMNNHPFMVISRRAIEVLKLLDLESDSFADDIQSASAGGSGALGFPTFGIGYGEPEAMGTKAGEEGVGLLAGAWEDVVLQMMCSGGVDDEFFAEMDSLVRMGTALNPSIIVPPIAVDGF